MEPGKPLHRLDRRRPDRHRPRTGPQGRRTAQERRLYLRPGLFLAAQARHPHPVDRPGRDGRHVHPGRRDLAPERAPLRRPAGPEQGRDRRHGDEQVLVWRRAYAIAPEPLALDDERHPRFDKRYAKVPADQLPATECLKDTVARVLPFWNESIAPAIRAGTKRADRRPRQQPARADQAPGQCVGRRHRQPEHSTGQPLVYELDDDLRPIRHYYLGDAAEIEAAMAAVARGRTGQGRKGSSIRWKQVQSCVARQGCCWRSFWPVERFRPAPLNDLAGRQSVERQQAAARPHRPAKDIDTRAEAARKEAADALKHPNLPFPASLLLRELAEANRQAQADLGSLEKQIGAQQRRWPSAASSWPTSCAPSTPAVCRPGRRCCPATIRNCWAAIWATWITCPRPAPRRCRRCAPTSTGWPRCRARPTPVAPRSKSGGRDHRAEDRPGRPAEERSTLLAQLEGRSPPSAPRPTSWAGTTSACRA